MVITIVIGILTMGWVIYNFGPEIFKGKNEKNDSMEQEPMPELDPLDYGEDSDVTGNIVNDLWAKNEKLKIQVKELESKVSFLMGIHPEDREEGERSEHVCRYARRGVHDANRLVFSHWGGLLPHPRKEDKVATLQNLRPLRLEAGSWKHFASFSFFTNVKCPRHL